MKKGNIGVWLLIVIVVAGGFWYFASQSKPTQVPIQTQTVVQPSTAPSEDVTQKEVTINVTTSGFDPQTATVKAGTKVTWMNKSGATANVSSAVHPTHLVYPPLNLGNVDDGKSVSLVFDKAGTYKYHNHLDPTQFGSVVVE